MENFTLHDLILYLKSNLKDANQIVGKYGFNRINKPLPASYKPRNYVSDYGVPFILSTSRNLETRIKIMSDINK